MTAAPAIRPLAPSEDPPWGLLLDADPSEEMVKRYLPQSEIFVMETAGEIIGVVVLTPVGGTDFEIKNVAVADDHQGHGHGKALVAHAIARAREEAARTLHIGTGDTGTVQLALYQKMGFRIAGTDEDFFTRNPYPPLEENGRPVRHMVRMEMNL